MSELSVHIDGVGKLYRIGQGAQAGYKTLREQISTTAMAPFKGLYSVLAKRSNLERQTSDREFLWALKNISFDIRRGEVMGIIGRNGAGKSTLLKILTRITEPTEGSIDLYGRVGSLLEVGTGFHKELTGRENIYLNGAILGMRKVEIDRKFDEMVSFAEIEKFIDTPVKFYSSGMFVRLAFAVAAHLEPEILLVDEVLSVGDASFQKKCLNKMEDVGKEGRTIVFVSHHMPSVTRLCERAILLDNGQMIMDGPTTQVVSAYLSSGLGTSSTREWPELATAPGSEIVRLCAVRVKTADGRVTDTVETCQPVGIEMEYVVQRPGYILYPHFTVQNEEGVMLFASIDLDPEWRRKPRLAGRYVSTAWIPGNFLAEGTVIIGPAMRTEEPRILHYYERDSVAFQVIESLSGDSARADYPGRFPGVVRPRLDWNTQFFPNGYRSGR